jgi:uncharacterized protein (DUF697 family)
MGNDGIPEDIRKKIHLWAAAGAVTAAALPVGADAVALSAEEVLMVIQVGSYCRVSIDKAAAQAILSGAVAQAVGGAAFSAAIAALEVANVGYPLTIPVKVGIAVGIIELVGVAAYRYFTR